MPALSPYLIAVLAGWVAAQGSKYLLAAFKTKKLGSLRQLYLSGNMPSAHSATSVALLVVIGLYEGFDSAIFGLAVLVAGIAMYDAMMVRRSVGEQGLALQELITSGKLKMLMPRAARGHTPLEVTVGAWLGLIIGIVVFIATK